VPTPLNLILGLVGFPSLVGVIIVTAATIRIARRHDDSNKRLLSRIDHSDGGGNSFGGGSANCHSNRSRIAGWDASLRVSFRCRHGCPPRATTPAGERHWIGVPATGGGRGANSPVGLQLWRWKRIASARLCARPARLRFRNRSPSGLFRTGHAETEAQSRCARPPDRWKPKHRGDVLYYLDPTPDRDADKTGGPWAASSLIWTLSSSTFVLCSAVQRLRRVLDLMHV